LIFTPSSETTEDIELSALVNEDLEKIQLIANSRFKVSV
jgi:hypothetical protein